MTDRQPHETARADFCMVEFCEHGYASIYLFWNGRDAPFAVAHLGPESATSLAAEIVENIKPKGHA